MQPARTAEVRYPAPTYITNLLVQKAVVPFANWI
jgi:hypothetical protein